MSTADALLLLKGLWFCSSLIGGVFFGYLLLTALMDLNYRRDGGTIIRSAVLLAWRTVVFDATLMSTFFLDFVVGVISFVGPVPWLSVSGLIASNLIRTSLGAYLWWVRLQIMAAGKSETTAETEYYKTLRTLQENDVH